MAPSPSKKPLKGILKKPARSPSPPPPRELPDWMHKTADEVYGDLDFNPPSRSPSPKRRSASPPPKGTMRSPPKAKPQSPTKQRRAALDALIRNDMRLIREEVKDTVTLAKEDCRSPSPERQRAITINVKRIDDLLDGMHASSKALLKRSGEIHHPLIADERLPEAFNVYPEETGRVSTFKKLITFDDAFAKWIKATNFGSTPQDNKALHALLDPLADIHIGNRVLMVALLNLATWANNLRPEPVSATNKIRGFKYDATFAKYFASDIEMLQERRPDSYMYKKEGGGFGHVEAFASGSMRYTDFAVIVSNHVVKHPHKDQLIRAEMSNNVRDVEKAYEAVQERVIDYKEGRRIPVGGKITRMPVIEPAMIEAERDKRRPKRRPPPKEAF